MPRKKTNRSVIVFCAHPDDEVIGPGGTLLKYAKEGIETIVVIFSGGEMSNTLYEKQKLVDLREEESNRAGNLLQISKIINLQLRDMNLTVDCKDPKVCDKIMDIIREYDPEKIFTHSMDDVLYIDHRAVHDVVLKAVKTLNEKRKKQYPLFTFNVWTLNIRGRHLPRLVVDIEHEFTMKMMALREFKSQKLALLQLTPVVFIRAIFAGWKHDCRYAEEFYKII